MPSGATITSSGMTTMTQVVAGTDTVVPADFNNARTNVNLLLGTAADVTLGTYTAASTYGYTQGGAGVSAASTGGLIYADNATGGFKRLQDDVQSLCAFLGQTVRTGVGTDVTTATSIAATTWNNLMLNIKDCWDNRFAPASTTMSSDSNVTRATAWVSTLTEVTTWTFASEGAARAFFNAGGALGVSSSRSGGSASTQNTDWTNLLSSMGDVLMNYNDTTGSSGTSAGLGFYELTASDQQLFIKYGSGAYASNYFRLQGRVNSITDPTVITLTATWFDPYTAAAAAAADGAIGPDGVPSSGDETSGYTDSIDGTLTLNGRRRQPNANGSSITITAPTISMAAISGS
jgi:hypothetical protein